MTDKHYKKFRWFLMPSAWSSMLWFDDSSVQSSADAINVRAGWKQYFANTIAWLSPTTVAVQRLTIIG